MQSQNYHEISRGKRKLARTLKKNRKNAKPKQEDTVEQKW